MKRSKVVVLLSAGLDSSVNLYKAYQQDSILMALTFNYGQKAAVREVQAAEALAAGLKVPHKTLSLPFFSDFNRSSLLVEAESVPTGVKVDIHDLKTSQATAQSVWVPNRNGIFLNIAAGFAEALGAAHVVPGFNAEEAATFPDNTEDYMRALDHSFSFSTANKVSVKCYTSSLNKTQIVKMAVDLEMPLEKIWPCYFAGESWCGQCESCLRSKNAFVQAGLDEKKYFKGR
jgi:7-cyano-7-deazaguanine synthase